MLVFVPDSRQETKNVRDRRFQRTQGLLLDAFAELIGSRTYGVITVADIAERADVGRSTFYEHYESKEHLLRQSMAPIVTALGSTLENESATDNLRLIVSHVRDNRRFSISMLSHEPRQLVTRFLAEELERRLRRRQHFESLPLRFVAQVLSETQIGLLSAWVSGDSDDGLNVDNVAEALVVSTQAIERALLRMPRAI
jgi:AcrR family transcriptional regulator